MYNSLVGDATKLERREFTDHLFFEFRFVVIRYWWSPKHFPAEGDLSRLFAVSNTSWSIEQIAGRRRFIYAAASVILVIG